jgi:hypothetical protein
MLVLTKLDADFFEGVCGLEDRPLTFRDPQGILPFAHGEGPAGTYKPASLRCLYPLPHLDCGWFNVARSILPVKGLLARVF